MTIHLRPATDSDVRLFALWKYEPPYEVYGINMDPGDSVAYFLSPAVCCRTLVEGDDVVGFCTFGHDAQVPGGTYDEAGLDIGLGIDPDRVGRGEGHRFVAAVIAHAQAVFEPRQLRVTVAAANERALRVWEGAGFTEVSRFVRSEAVMGSKEFAMLALDPAADHCD